MILESLGAILSGGVTGLIGSAITSYTDLKKQKMLLAHKEVMERLSFDMMKLEAESKIKVVEVETEGKISVADAQLLAESYKADRATYSTEGKRNVVVEFLLGLVDVCRGSVRPLLTYYFTVLISIQFFRFFSSYSELNTSPEVLGEMLNKITITILYVGTTVVLWWFGTRNKLFDKNGK